MWFEMLKGNECDSGKLYHINHNLWRESYKAGQKSGRTAASRNAGLDTDVSGGYTAVL